MALLRYTFALLLLASTLQQAPASLALGNKVLHFPEKIIGGVIGMVQSHKNKPSTQATFQQNIQTQTTFSHQGSDAVGQQLWTGPGAPQETGFQGQAQIQAQGQFGFGTGNQGANYQGSQTAPVYPVNNGNAPSGQYPTNPGPYVPQQGISQSQNQGQFQNNQNQGQFQNQNQQGNFQGQNQNQAQNSQSGQYATGNYQGVGQYAPANGNYQNVGQSGNNYQGSASQSSGGNYQTVGQGNGGNYQTVGQASGGSYQNAGQATGGNYQNIQTGQHQGSTGQLSQSQQGQYGQNQSGHYQGSQTVSQSGQSSGGSQGGSFTSQSGGFQTSTSQQSGGGGQTCVCQAWTKPPAHQALSDEPQPDKIEKTTEQTKTAQ